MEKKEHLLPYLPDEIKIKIIEYVDDIDIRRYFRVYRKIPKNDFRYKLLKKKKLIKQKIGGPDWVGYHPHDHGYYGEVTYKTDFLSTPITVYGIKMKIIAHRIAVLAIDEATRTQGGTYKDSVFNCCGENYDTIMWSSYDYSPETNIAFNENTFNYK